MVRSSTILILLAGMAVAGCSSTSDIDTAFSDIAPPPAAEPPPSDLVPAIALRDTGAYPNINAEPATQLEPLSDADEAAMVARMEALAAQHAAGRISTAAYRARVAQLRQLAATHSAQTLRQIEGQ